MYTLGKISKLVDGTLRLPIYEGANVVESITFPADDLVQVIVELASEYEVSPVTIADLFGDASVPTPDMNRDFKGVDIFYDQVSDAFVAQCKNGDTGANVSAEGKRVANAVANLATNFGYKSKIHNDGPRTIKQWFIDFQYGHTRISDELLKAEMDLMFEPDAGAW